MTSVRFTVDWEPVEVRPATSDLLLDTLRGLGHTQVKEGCGVGVCGLCSVLVDGWPASSCLRLTATCGGTEILTAAGVARARPELAAAFASHEAFQCGICTPGQLVMAAAVLARNPRPAEAEVRELMAGNLCRCTGYRTIVEAILAAGGS